MSRLFNESPFKLSNPARLTPGSTTPPEPDPTERQLRVAPEPAKRANGETKNNDTKTPGVVDQAAPGPIPPTPFQASSSSSASRALALNHEVEVEKQAWKQLTEQIGSFDWRKLPPPMTVRLIRYTPQRSKEGDFYLDDVQAWRHAIRCFELDLSPFSTEVWYNPRTNVTQVTYEGKLVRVRKLGLKMSPPKFERIPPQGPIMAYKATIETPDGVAEYIATVKEWANNSPTWKEKPEHMLQIRAAEKCLSFAMGTGTSEMPDDDEPPTAVDADWAPDPRLDSPLKATPFVEAPDEETTSGLLETQQDNAEVSKGIEPERIPAPRKRRAVKGD